MDTLKPCPFCGYEFTPDDHAVYPVKRERDILAVRCENPECAAQVLGWTEQQAIEAWNKRTSEWVSVDTPPKEDQRVIAIDDRGYIYDCVFKKGKFIFRTVDSLNECAATHWQPISPPKGDE